jgi:DnaK suppressor protein
MPTKKKTATKVAKSKGGKKTSKIRGTKGRHKKTLAIRTKLVEQKEQLLHEAGVALNSLPEESAFPDMGDQATAEIDRNFMLRLRGREQRLLKKIEHAIEKIDNGTYGICEGCGCEIGIKRLEVRPVTTMCIECKIEQEEEEKLMEA